MNNKQVNTAAVTSVNHAGPWNWNGQQYNSFQVSFSDGMNALNITKQQQSPFTIGQTVKYEATQCKYPNGQPYVTVKLYKEDTRNAAPVAAPVGNNNASRPSKQQSSIAASVAIKGAIDLACNKVINKDQLYNEAEQMYQWLMNKS